MHEVVNKSFGLAMFLSGQDKVYSFIPPHQGGSLDFAFHKKKEFGEKNERRPLVGTVRRLGNTPFPTQRIGSIRHQASCRHLRYIECFLTPITPTGDHMAVPIRPKERCCIPFLSTIPWQPYDRFNRPQQL